MNDYERSPRHNPYKNRYNINKNSNRPSSNHIIIQPPLVLIGHSSLVAGIGIPATVWQIRFGNSDSRTNCLMGE